MSLLLGLLGLAVVPIVFSVPAIVFATRARRQIARTPGLHGSNAAGWGLAMGVMGTILGLLLVASFAVGATLPT
jgi:Na+/H+-dicarboxylate symporter